MMLLLRVVDQVHFLKNGKLETSSKGYFIVFKCRTLQRRVVFTKYLRMHLINVSLLTNQHLILFIKNFKVSKLQYIPSRELQIYYGLVYYGYEFLVFLWNTSCIEITSFCKTIFRKSININQQGKKFNLNIFLQFLLFCDHICTNILISELELFCKIYGNFKYLRFFPSKFTGFSCRV